MTPCSVCSSEQGLLLFELSGYAVSRCDRCSHVFVSSSIAAGALDGAYGRAYYDSGGAADCVGYEDYLRDIDTRTRGFRDRLAQIERYVGTRGHLLDYGCAVGLMVKAAADAGWTAVGYERSDWAAQYGRDTFGLDIVRGDGESIPQFEGRFHVVTMWDVLEHLEHPREVLESVAGWLKPGGLLALNTVNSSSLGARLAGAHWRHLAPPHHLQFFSRASLERLLQDCGFDVIARSVQGVMTLADRRMKVLRVPAAWIEGIATHWRTKKLATAFNLLDEIDMFAIRK